MVKSVVRKESFSSSSSSCSSYSTTTNDAAAAAVTSTSGRVFNSNSTNKYKGVRKRKWGKYVSEIRLPNSRERIWLGSYDTAEKAARAFDAALFCLRGKSANFNFPDNPPEIVNGRSMTPAEIQVAAARFANSEDSIISGGRESVRVDNSENSCSTFSSSELQADSPCPSVSDGVVQVENEMAEIPLDTSFLDMFSTLGTDNNVADFGIFPGFDDFFASPLPNADYGDENYEGYSSSQDSFLWNF